MDILDLVRWILYVDGRKWGAYLTKADAEEVAARLRGKGRRVELRHVLEGWSDE